MRRLAAFVRDTLSLGLVLVGEAVDRWAEAPELGRTVQELRNRISVLEEELASARDEARFNGPSLYRDEVEVLRFISKNDGARVWANQRQVLSTLLDRSDHMPMTEAELRESLREGTVPWPDRPWTSEDGTVSVAPMGDLPDDDLPF